MSNKSIKSHFTIKKFILQFLYEHPEYEPFVLNNDFASSLSDCLYCYQKNILSVIAKNNFIENSESLTKSKLVSATKNSVLDNFIYDFRFQDPIYFSCFSLLFFEDSPQESLIAKMEKHFSSDELYFIYSKLFLNSLLHGFLFLYREKDELNFFNYNL